MNKKGRTLKEDFIEAVQSFKKKDFKNPDNFTVLLFQLQLFMLLDINLIDNCMN